MQQPIFNRIDPSNLVPHEENAKVYGEPAIDQDFLESIKRGMVDPIQITTDMLIISGHRRHAAALKLGLEKVPVFVRHDIKDPNLIKLALVESNQYRERTIEQKAREVRLRTQALNELYKAKSAERPKGESRDIAGGEAGWSGSTVTRATEAVEEIDKALEEGDEETAEEIREALNRSPNKGATVAKKVAKKKKAPQAQVPAGGKVTPPTLDENLKEWGRPFSGLTQKINNLQKEFAGLADDEGGVFVTDIAKQDFLSAAKQLAEVVKHAKPVKHKTCKGSGCNECKGQGFVRGS